MEEKQNAQAQLDFIKQTISDSRNIILDNGIGFIVWGIIIIICLSYTYIDVLAHGDLKNDYIWYILITGGWIYTFWDYKQRAKNRRVSTFAGKVLGSVWMSVGISLTILGFVGTSVGAFQNVFISPILSVVLGVGFYVTARIFNYVTGMILSALWWVGAIVMFIFPGVHVLIIMAAMMLFLQVIPGVVLYQRSKNEISNE